LALATSDAAGRLAAHAKDRQLTIDRRQIAAKTSVVWELGGQFFPRLDQPRHRSGVNWLEVH
jgi:hypothetical protein